MWEIEKESLENKREGECPIVQFPTANFHVHDARASLCLADKELPVAGGAVASPKSCN